MKHTHIAFTILLFAAPALHAALPGAESLAGLITKQFDANGDSILDQTEWQTGIASGFQEMDGDGDGSTTALEIDSLAGSISKETGELAGKVVTVLIKQLVLTMDTDKDGAVSLKEYTTQATAIFSKLDVNKNGSVEQAELVELPKRLIGA